MATASKDPIIATGATGPTSSRSATETGNVGSPISNEAYNVISALQSKLEGLEAYRKYAKDSSSALWRELSNDESQCVAKLVDELERLVHDGKFRVGTPGRGNG